MKKETSNKWDKRYKKGWHKGKNTSKILKKWISEVEKNKALDIACGTGRNSIYLAQNGFDVDAVDLSKEAINIATKKSNKKNIDVNWIQDDFNEMFLPNKYYELITSTNFYLKKEINEIRKALTRNGYFIYHHHLKIKDEEPIAGPPTSYRFDEKEIKKLLDEFEIKYYEENVDKKQKRTHAYFDLVAKKKPTH